MYSSFKVFVVPQTIPPGRFDHNNYTFGAKQISEAEGRYIEGEALALDLAQEDFESI